MTYVVSFVAGIERTSEKEEGIYGNTKNVPKDWQGIRVIIQNDSGDICYFSDKESADSALIQINHHCDTKFQVLMKGSSTNKHYYLFSFTSDGFSYKQNRKNVLDLPKRLDLDFSSFSCGLFSFANRR